MLGTGNDIKVILMTVSLLGIDIYLDGKKTFKSNGKLRGFFLGKKKNLIKFWSFFRYRMYHIEYTIPQNK